MDLRFLGLLSLLIHFTHFVLWRILQASSKCVQMVQIAALWRTCLFFAAANLKNPQRSDASSQFGEFVQDVCVTTCELSDSCFLLHNFLSISKSFHLQERRNKNPQNMKLPPTLMLIFDFLSNTALSLLAATAPFFSWEHYSSLNAFLQIIIIIKKQMNSSSCL